MVVFSQPQVAYNMLHWTKTHTGCILLTKLKLLSDSDFLNMILKISLNVCITQAIMFLGPPYKYIHVGWTVKVWTTERLLHTWEQGELAMKLLYDVYSQQGPDLLLHDLICKEGHTDQMEPDTHKHAWVGQSVKACWHMVRVVLPLLNTN